MSKAYVTFKVEGRFIAEVDADTIGNALEKARVLYYDADFGVLEEIDSEPIIVESEDGRIIDDLHRAGIENQEIGHGK